MSILNFIKGIFIGIALVVPGLSGSMFSVVVGLYDRLLDAVNYFRSDMKKNSIFLLPVLMGVAVGILSSTKLVLWLCQQYKLQSYAFFIGLVVGSIPLVYRKMTSKRFCFGKLIISFAAFTAIIAISLLASSINEDSAQSYISITAISGIEDILNVFFAGIFSCSLMAIPGVSGSIILMLINQYGSIYNAVSQIGDMIKYTFQGDFAQTMSLLPTVAIIIPFMAGAVIGIILIAKLLLYLLNKFEAEVYYGVLGLVAGAIVVLFKEGIFNEMIFNISFGMLKGIMGILIISIFVIVGAMCSKFFDDSNINSKSLVQK